MAKTPSKSGEKSSGKAVDDLPPFRNGEEFDALSDADKERIWQSYERQIPLSETQPLNPAQRKLWNGIKQGIARPKTGAGAAAVRVTIERGLLRRADRYAEAAGFTRSQLVARGLEAVLKAATED